MTIRNKRILSSIPINSLDENSKFPQSMGSSCFVHYGKYTIFLTVYHTIDDNSSTSGIVCDFDKNKGVKLLPLGLVSPIASGNIFSNNIEIVDFSYARMNKMPQCQYFELDNAGNIFKQENRIELVSDFLDLPIPKEDYGFAGYTYGYPSNNPFVNANIQKIWN